LLEALKRDGFTISGRNCLIDAIQKNLALKINNAVIHLAQVKPSDRPAGIRFEAGQNSCLRRSKDRRCPDC